VERDNHLAAGVSILLVMEQEATLVQGGYDRGVSAARAANDQADGLGYPSDCPIFYADDSNATDPAVATDFVRGALSVGRRPVGLYSSGACLAAVTSAFPYQIRTWRVETWSPADYPNPDMVQLANTRDPAMVGVDPSTYDTNLLYRPIPMWGGTAASGGFSVSDLDTIGQWLKDTEARIEAHVDATIAAHPSTGGVSAPVDPQVASQALALQNKMSIWFGQIEDKIAAVHVVAATPPAITVSGPKIADIQKAVHTELSNLTIGVK
jgi:hypothetical protein